MDKKGHKELLIIMPAYNEEKNIGKVLEQLERAGVCEYADVLVMNDASSDATNWLVKARGYTLVTHVSVSYTHLDVYRRQDDGRGVGQRI